MKNIKILYLSFIAMIAFVGCNDWLDVNESPNSIRELQAPKVVIPVAQVNIANGIMGWDMGFAGAFWSQYWTQDHTSSQFKTLDEYEETDFDDAYNNLLPYALNDLKKISTISPVESGEYLIAEALSIYAWQIVTDTWGDIPYTEALKGDEDLFSPNFDKQQDIYSDLLNRTNVLLAQDYSEATITPSYDFIYAGDINLWVTFVKSLKLKLMLRLSETAGYNNAEVLAFVTEGGFLTETAKINGDIWEVKAGKQHPMVEAQVAGYFDNVLASSTFVEWLVSVNDPRIGNYFSATAAGYKGSLQGDFASKADADGNGVNDDEEEYSRVSFDGATDIPLMSAWEINFYIAEVYIRAGDNANAKTYYDAAVSSSCAYWGVDNTLTVAGGPAEWKNGTLEECLEQIGIQKWVSYCKLQHIEAFIERNRIKYPAVNKIDVERNRTEVYTNFPAGEFVLSVAGRAKLSEKLPSSPIYPNAVVTRNTTKPSQKTSLGDKVWWNQKNEIER